MSRQLQLPMHSNIKRNLHSSELVCIYSMQIPTVPNWYYVQAQLIYSHSYCINNRPNDRFSPFDKSKLHTKNHAMCLCSPRTWRISSKTYIMHSENSNNRRLLSVSISANFLICWNIMLLYITSSQIHSSLTGSVIGRVTLMICPASFHSGRSGTDGAWTLNVTAPCSKRCVHVCSNDWHNINKRHAWPV